MNEEIAKQTATIRHSNDNGFESFEHIYRFLNDKLFVVVQSFKNENGEDKYISFEFNDENLYDNIKIDNDLQDNYTIRIQFNQMNFTPNELNDLEQKLIIIQRYVEEIKHIGKLFGIEFNK